MTAPYPSETSDGDSFMTQYLLFLRSKPADITGKGIVVRECVRHVRWEGRALALIILKQAIGDTYFVDLGEEIGVKGFFCFGFFHLATKFFNL